MELAQIGADVYACLQPDTGLGAVELGVRQRRRRAGRRHDVGPAPHPPHDRPLRHRVAGAGPPPGQHPPQRRPLLGQPALRRDRAPRSSATACAPSGSPRRRQPELFVALCEADDVPPPARRLRPGAARLRLPRHRAHAADHAARRRHRPRPRRGRGAPALRRPGPHARRRRGAPAGREHRVHRRHPLPPLHADRLGGHVRQLDRRARRASRRSTRRRSCPATARSPPSTGCGASASTSSTSATRPGPASRPGSPRSRPRRRIDLGPYGLWTEPERLAFQVDRAYRELVGRAVGRAGRHRPGLRRGGRAPRRLRRRPDG